MDCNRLLPKQLRAWKAYQEAMKDRRETREALEEALQEDLPKGKALKVNFRFGKIQVALVDASTVKAPKKTKAMSLAEFLEQ